MPSGLRTVVTGVLDAAAMRSLIVETNDGIVATAGVVEGFAGAGAIGSALVVAALSTMIAGGIALGGARYAEEAAEREARVAVIEEERRRLALSPEQEMAELVALYEAKGLSPDLAQRVARELSVSNALAAHVEVEHGLTLRDAPYAPVVIAVMAGLAFAVGSAIPLFAVVVTPHEWRPAVVFVAVLVSLTLTSAILARVIGTPPRRVVVRSVLVAMTAMLLSLAVGSLFEP